MTFLLGISPPMAPSESDSLTPIQDKTTTHIFHCDPVRIHSLAGMQVMSVRNVIARKILADLENEGCACFILSLRCALNVAPCIQCESGLATGVRKVLGRVHILCGETLTLEVIVQSNAFHFISLFSSTTLHPHIFLCTGWRTAAYSCIACCRAQK